MSTTSVNANNGMMTLNVIFDTSTVATTDQILAQMRQAHQRRAVAAGCPQLRRPSISQAPRPRRFRALFARRDLRSHVPRELLLHQYQ